MASVTDEIKAAFKQGDIVTRLILLNAGIFVAVNILYVFLWLFQIPNMMVFGGQQVEFHWYWLGAPADLVSLLFKPWTLITYMFVHGGIGHLFFNMLLLYFSGQIFKEYLGSTRILATYVLGGLAGIFLYIIAYNIFPIFSEVLPFSLTVGASASVMAVLIAVTAYVPNHSVRLPFIGLVKLKYIAGVMVLLDVINIRSGNPGGHIAHLGGALYGFYFARQYRKGTDLSTAFNRFVTKAQEYFFKPKSHLNVSYSSRRRHKSDEEYNYEKKVNQQKMDDILDKISKSGYESLSKEEKDILFKFGDKG